MQLILVDLDCFVSSFTKQGFPFGFVNSSQFSSMISKLQKPGFLVAGSVVKNPSACRNMGVIPDLVHAAEHEACAPQY